MIIDINISLCDDLFIVIIIIVVIIITHIRDTEMHIIIHIINDYTACQQPKYTLPEYSQIEFGPSFRIRHLFFLSH